VTERPHTNRFLVRRPDRHWPLVLSTVLGAAALLFAALLLVGWPRLKATTIHYDLVQMRKEVESLRHLQRRLAIEVERERGPARLAERARELGLQPPPPPALLADPPGVVAPARGQVGAAAAVVTASANGRTR